MSDEKLTFEIIEGALEGDNAVAVQNAFNVLLEKVEAAKALEPNISAYQSACNAVVDAASALNDAAATAGVVIELADWYDTDLGVGHSFKAYDDYGYKWTKGARLADTWIPSSMSC